MSIYIRYPVADGGDEIRKVATAGDLPTTGVSNGDLAITLDDDTLYAYQGSSSSWVVIATPASSQDTNAKYGCRVATTANLSAIYSNGSSGVGASLTSTINEILVIDTITVGASNRVLVKDQSSTLQNGIYTLTQVGTVLQPWILTRATDYNTGALASRGAYTAIANGEANEGTVWVQNSAAPTIGSDAITFLAAGGGANRSTAKSGVRTATTGNLAANYNNGSSGVGATLTSLTNTALNLDGYSNQEGDRLLIKDQTLAYQNGIYVMTQQGSGSQPWILTRASDFDTTELIQPGSYTAVADGLTNYGKVYVYANNAPGVGVDDIEFSTIDYLTLPAGVANGSMAYFTSTAIADIPEAHFNSVAASFSFGTANLASGITSFVLGGNNNTASATNSVIVGGASNEAHALNSSIVGCETSATQSGCNFGYVMGSQSSGPSSGTHGGAIGCINTDVEGNHAVGIGGADLVVDGNFAFASGDQCTANGAYTFARGSQAKAIHVGATVLTDSELSNMDSIAADSFTSRFGGGHRIVGGGPLQISASTEYPDIDIFNNTINPFINGDLLTFKWKDSGGTVHSHTLTEVENSNVSFSVWQTVAQTITNGVATKLTLDNSTFNHGNYFDTSTSKFLPLVQGIYLVTAQVEYVAPAGAAAVIEVWVYKNGSVVAQAKSDVPLGEFDAFTVPFLAELNGTSDYLEVYTRITGNGGSNGTINNAPYATYFQGHLVSIGNLNKNNISVTGTTKTFAMSDSFTTQVCSNASTQTLTVPPNSSVAFPIGTQIDVVQTGVGQVVIAAGVGVSIGSKLGNLKIAAQYAAASLLKTATDTWVLVGDLTA